MAAGGTESPNEHSANENSDDSNHVTSDSQGDDDEEGDTSDEDCVTSSVLEVDGPIAKIPPSGSEPVKLEVDPDDDLGHEPLDGIKTDVISEDAYPGFSTKIKARLNDINNFASDVKPHTDEKSKDSSHSSHHKLLVAKEKTSRPHDVKVEHMSLNQRPPSSPGSPEMSPLALSKLREATPHSMASLASGSKSGSRSDSADLPLDLSNKSEKLSAASAFCTRSSGPSTPHPLTPKGNPSSPPCLPNANGLSSLQSLQQRFGGSSPMELLRRPGGSSVISLQPSLTPKGLSSALHPSPEELLRLQDNGSRAKLSMLGDWMEKMDGQMSRSPSNSPSHKGDASSHQSSLMPLSDDGEMRGKHTIHRCSCQKAFNSLYALSVHIQETGHTPLSGKSVSLMDYPKLVRGQDMWLNQESEQTRRILRCMQCGESFKSLPLLTVHMMQTQHYTKIVSSEHGRRSHKCSTYCDRDLDRECIFKCKVCQDAFTDMEGLANHMIVSGHHKKQGSRVAPAPSPVVESASNLALALRHGKRKRFIQEEEQVSNGFTVANLLECKRKQQGSLSNVNGLGKTASSSASPPSMLASNAFLACDSCGKKVEAHDFDSHVRACLRQRAEVIDALKTKLAAEEAILSRSESKLLQSGFSLSSLSKSSHDNEASSKLSSEKSSERTFRTKSTHSDAAIGDNSSRYSPKIAATFKRESQACFSGEKKASILDRNQLEPRSGQNRDSMEMPLKCWRRSNGDSRIMDESGGTVNARETLGKISPLRISSPNELPRSGVITKIKEEATSPFPNAGELGCHESDSEERRDVCGRRLSGKSSDSAVRKGDPNRGLVSDSEKMESMDYGSSALHKLDMFSRRLELSPPRNALSRESKLSSTQHQRLGKRPEGMNTISGAKRQRSSQAIPSSTPVSGSSSVSPLSASLKGSRLKSESPDSQPKSASFDIMDPNADNGSQSGGGALEAMESFIKKSFSTKSDLRSSSLVSMFSPFGNSFPLPGSVSNAQCIPLSPADPSVASFAKFSKFFSMVPGAGIMPQSTGHGSSMISGNSSLSEVQTKTSARHSLFRGDNANASPPLKIPAVKIPNPLPYSHWKHGIESESKEETATDVKNRSMKRNESSTFTSQGKQSISNGCSDSSSLHNGESRLPSSVELYERQDLLRKKRRRVDDGHPRMSKSPRGEMAGEMESVNIKLEVDFEKYEEKASRSEDARTDVQTRENVTDDTVTVSSFGHGHSKQSLKVSLSPPVKSTNPSSSLPIPEIQKGGKLKTKDADNARKQTSPPVCAEGGGSDVPTDEDECIKNSTKDSSSRHRYPDRFSLDDDSANACVKTRTLCKSPDSVHSDSLVPGEEKCSISRRRSNSMEESASHIGNTRSVGSWKSLRISRLNGNAEKKLKLAQPEENVGRGVDMEDSDQDHDEPKGVGLSKTILHSPARETKDALSMDCSESLERSMKVKVEDDEEEKNKREEEHDDDDDDDERSASCRNHTGMEASSTSSSGILSEGKPNVAKDNPTGTVSTNCNDTEEDDHGPADISANSDSESTLGNNDDEQLEEETRDMNGSGPKKTSALDTLSSFVYSQPLTSEHPLDSLQRLFTPRLSSEGHHHAPNVSSNRPHAPPSQQQPPQQPNSSSSSPLNLTTRGSDADGADGCVNEDGEELDAEAADFSEGCLADGDPTEYKCAACNRRFASKGSYRYHLSRCHLSSVKKYGIKEAFNMSPYVYLPLDHTAKFSKYYQMAQELANKGK